MTLTWLVNEAFAVVAAKFIRDLNLDPTKVNVNGGAMALGHPIAATGSMRSALYLMNSSAETLKQD